MFLVFSAFLVRAVPAARLFRDCWRDSPNSESGFLCVREKVNVEEKAGTHPELESPGGQALAVKLGGADAKSRYIGLPFIVFLDAAGKPIVNSNRPVQGQHGGVGIGYPSEPEEIDWFMVMSRRKRCRRLPQTNHTRLKRGYEMYCRRDVDFFIQSNPQGFLQGGLQPRPGRLSFVEKQAQLR